MHQELIAEIQELLQQNEALVHLLGQPSAQAPPPHEGEEEEPMEQNQHEMIVPSSEMISVGSPSGLVFFPELPRAQPFRAYLEEVELNYHPFYPHVPGDGVRLLVLAAFATQA